MRKILIVIKHSEMSGAEALAKDKLSGFQVSFSHTVLSAAQRVKLEKYSRGDGVIHVTGTVHAINHHLGDEQSLKFLRDAATGQGAFYHNCRYSVLEVTMLTLKDEINRVCEAAAAAVTA